MGWSIGYLRVLFVTAFTCTVDLYVAVVVKAVSDGMAIGGPCTATRPWPVDRYSSVLSVFEQSSCAHDHKTHDMKTQLSRVINVCMYATHDRHVLLNVPLCMHGVRATAALDGLDVYCSAAFRWACPACAGAPSAIYTAWFSSILA